MPRPAERASFLCQWAPPSAQRSSAPFRRKLRPNWPTPSGCSHTILYTKQDFVAEVSRISGGEKLPVVFDSVGKDTFLRSLDCLRPRGLMVTFGQASGPIDPICARSAVAEGFAVSDAPTPLPLHTAPRCAGKLRERAVRGGGFGERCALTSISALRSRMLQTPTSIGSRATSGSTILTI